MTALILEWVNISLGVLFICLLLVACIFGCKITINGIF